MAQTGLVGGEQLVVLVDEDGRSRDCGEGITPSRGHSLASGFLAYFFDGDGRVLTRRALHKRTWPGTWTNSFCDQPLPGEPTVDAVRRRGRQKLGVTIDEAVCVLPDFRYHAVAADGTVENEICPVFCARADDSVRPAPAEVMDYRWVPWLDVRRSAGVPWAISHLAVEQIALLNVCTYIDDGLNSSE